MSDSFEFLCLACNVQLSSISGWKSHLKTKKHRFNIKNCRFGINGAKTIIDESKLLPGQKGVFADEDIAKNTIIT